MRISKYDKERRTQLAMEAGSDAACRGRYRLPPKLLETMHYEAWYQGYDSVANAEKRLICAEAGGRSQTLRSSST